MAAALLAANIQALVRSIAAVNADQKKSATKYVTRVPKRSSAMPPGVRTSSGLLVPSG